VVEEKPTRAERRAEARVAEAEARLAEAQAALILEREDHRDPTD
jgi:hypothetical protein